MNLIIYTILIWKPASAKKYGSKECLENSKQGCRTRKKSIKADKSLFKSEKQSTKSSPTRQIQ